MIRDYFYIEDGVGAYLTLAEHMENKKIHGEAFNFSNEEPLSVTGIVQKVLNVMKSDLEPIILNESNHEIEKQYLSSQKARYILKWKPFHSMDSGLKKTVSWYKNFL